MTTKKTPIGYKSTVQGDETTPPLPVYTLTAAQKRTRAEIGKLNAIIQLGEEAKVRRTEIERSCKHEVFLDESAGWFSPCNFRHCSICGVYRGAI